MLVAGSSGMRKRLPLAERLWSKVQRGDSSSCWLWTGAKTPGGYGIILLDHRPGNITTAHRAAYMVTNGAVPDGLIVMHSCDTPLCCNPAHLSVGTQRQNLADMRARGRDGDHRVFGERHGRMRVTDAQVRQIRRRYEKGESQQAIADRFGISQTQVSRIIRGENRRAREGTENGPKQPQARPPARRR